MAHMEDPCLGPLWGGLKARCVKPQARTGIAILSTPLSVAPDLKTLAPFLETPWMYRVAGCRSLLPTAILPGRPEECSYGPLSIHT